MSRMISPRLDELDRLEPPLTPGELRVVHWFNRLLPVGWEIYVQPFMNGLRPDFILLNPRVGVAIYEVKDWALERVGYHYRSGTHGQLALHGRRPDGSIYPIRESRDPLAQLELYRRELGQLYCPRLAESFTHNPKAWAVVTTGLIVPTATRQRVAEVFEPIIDNLDLRPDGCWGRLIGGDDLAGDNLRHVLPDSARNRSRFMRPEFAHDLRSWLTRPEINNDHRRPLELDSEQLQLVRTRTQSGFRRIKGAAGTGKSQVVAGRAAQLAAEGRQVLVVSYNVTLVHYLRMLAARYPRPGLRYANRVAWLHFHGWCLRVCAQADMHRPLRELFGKKNLAPWPEESQSDFLRREGDAFTQLLERELPALTARALDTEADRIDRFDAILVDEGQDFNLDWWTLLRRVLRPGGEMVLVADQTQDIYGRSERWTEDSMIGAGIRGRWNWLRRNHRLPARLIPLLQSFGNCYLLNANTDFPESDPEDALIHPVRLVWCQCSPEEEAAAAELMIRNLPRLAGGDRPLAFPDITYLTDRHEMGLTIGERLEARNIKVVHVFSRDKSQRTWLKRRFFTGEARVQGTTHHSFKGWESRALVVVGPRRSDVRALSLFYTAMTRCRKNPAGSFLAVVCSNPQLADFGRQWDCCFRFEADQEDQPGLERYIAEHTGGEAIPIFIEQAAERETKYHRTPRPGGEGE